jgi:hypothetical protein
LVPTAKTKNPLPPGLFEQVAFWLSDRLDYLISGLRVQAHDIEVIDPNGLDDTDGELKAGGIACFAPYYAPDSNPGTICQSYPNIDNEGGSHIVRAGE